MSFSSQNPFAPAHARRAVGSKSDNHELLRQISVDKRLKDPRWQAIEKVLLSGSCGMRLEPMLEALENDIRRALATRNQATTAHFKKLLKNEILTLAKIRERLCLRLKSGVR